MEDLIIISNLNDFIFCPASIYFHKLYGRQDNLLYQSSAQINGTKAHETIDEKTYSTRKSAMMSLDVYSEKYGLCGKIVGFSICLMSTTFKVYEVLGARMEGNTLLRRHQYDYVGDEIGRKIEQNKIRNQAQALRNIRRKTEYLKEGIQLLDDMQMQLEAELEYLEVMGIEGNAARVYFSRMFDNVQWNGRKPRIKNDYVNVTLDIGYTMLFNIVDAMLQVYGFDTYYGVFHKCFYMRKSLVCDIMEPMRPIVDYEIRKALNLGQCKAEDFDVYDQRWCLKYKKNQEYIQFLMKAILEYKDDIFLYVQQYYRYFMKRKSVEELPVFCF